MTSNSIVGIRPQVFVHILDLVSSNLAGNSQQVLMNMQFLLTSESFHLFHLFSNIVIIHLKKTFTGVTVLQVVLEVQGQDQICPLICQICHFP